MLDVELVQEGAIPLSVRLQCPAGELLALVGPSGAGKSTVLRAIAGLTKVSQGRVAIGGTAWQDSTKGTWIDARKRRVGMVFQNYALFPHLTALRNVAEAVHHLPRAERFARATDALAKVRLTGLEARTPSQLSGGQQQRLALARALVREPDVLLLDEPFSSVDQATRERLYEQLAELRVDLRIPIVLVTHSITEAQLLADRMTVIRRGETLQTGRPAAVLSRPVTGEVARLVGFRNLFRGNIEFIDPASGKASVSWGSQCIDIPTTVAVVKGQSLEWGIATGDVIVLKTGRDAPDLAVTFNGVLGKAVDLGDNVTLIIYDPTSAQSLRAVVTKRFFERANVVEGRQIRVVLPHDRIVFFPPSDDRSI